MAPGSNDGHPCGSCLRWDECNGVDWPFCPCGTTEARVDHLCKQSEAGIMTPNQARELLELGIIKEGEICQLRTNP